MPIYEYACTDCKEIWEIAAKIKDCLVPTNKKCPKCGAKRGSVYRHLSVAPACGIEFAHHGVGKHREGGFQEMISRLAESPGVKHTAHAQKLKDKHLD
jgi:putative FmdB family regulatory protein